MQTVRVLRTSTPNHLKQYLTIHIPTNSLSSSFTQNLSIYNRRTFCVPHPLQPHPSTTAPNLHTKPAEKSSPSPHPDNPVDTSKQTIPDIPSTSWSSIGFEQRDANDPNKWKKFAWKYAGAVLLFMISYKTLHWYTDRLEADAKRRRKEMEEDRDTAKQILTSNPSSTQPFPFLQPINEPPPLPKTTSELHELYLYKAQLEQNLQHLRSQTSTPDIIAQTNDIRAELKHLQEDIKLLEAKKSSS